MKIEVGDQMARLRDEAEYTINATFNQIASEHLHRDHEYAAKREAARSHLSGGDAGHLNAEAELRGISVDELATAVLAKPDHVLVRAIVRTRLILAARRAGTPEELKAVTAELSRLRG